VKNWWSVALAGLGGAIFGAGIGFSIVSGAAMLLPAVEGLAAFGEGLGTGAGVIGSLQLGAATALGGISPISLTGAGLLAVYETNPDAINQELASIDELADGAVNEANLESIGEGSATSGTVSRSSDYSGGPLDRVRRAIELARNSRIYASQAAGLYQELGIDPLERYSSSVVSREVTMEQARMLTRFTGDEFAQWQNMDTGEYMLARGDAGHFDLYGIDRVEAGQWFEMYHTHPDNPWGDMDMATGFDTGGDQRHLSWLGTQQRRLGFPFQTTSTIVPEKGYPFAYSVFPGETRLEIPIIGWEP
jgi:hypothetical protein